MLDSLRVRLLLWYALILSLIVLIFATTVCSLFWRSLVQGIDRDLRSASLVIVQALRPAASGDFDFDLPRQYRESEFTEHSPRTYYAVLDRYGEPIDRSDPDVPIEASTVLGVSTRSGRRELTVPGPNGSVVRVGRELGDAHAQVLALAKTVSAAGLLVLLLSSLGGWFLTGRALVPVWRISQAATAMSRGDLSARIPIEQTESELEQLAATLNEAFDRLRLAADAQRVFTADASHELRTPLATMSAEFDWALARPRDVDGYRQSIQISQRAAERIQCIVAELLTLARNDDGLLPARREPVELTEIVREALAMLQPLAEQRHIAMEASLHQAWMLGDPDQISELVTNLLKNAVEYSNDEAVVAVDVDADDRGVRLCVSDTGIGIAEEDLPHIFQRFYRADKARSRHTGGAGLGLAIAKRIVENHQGEIACQSAAGRGTSITVRFARYEDRESA
jgi:heavy metal sensor kinase